MNERIKQLAEQAGFDLYEDGSFRVEPGQWINAELERFADRIIMECAELSTGYTGNVKLLIMNHFGMELDALAKGKK
jgi:hypothetical protein